MFLFGEDYVRNHKRPSSLRIAMFGHKRIPSREGGIEIVVEELATRLTEQGWHVTCYNRSGHHVSGAEYDNKTKAHFYRGIRIKQVWTINAKGLAAVTSSISAAVCAAFGNYNVVHIHAEGPAFMCWLPKLCGKKVVCTVHGLDHKRAKWGRFASWYIKTGEKNAVRFADSIIVLSKSVQDYFAKEYNRQTVFIPNGVNKPEIREVNEIRAKWNLEKDSYVLFLGRLVPEKGLDYLLEAWKGIKTEKKLVIAGGSSDTQGYVAKLKEKAGNRVIFTGFQEGNVLEELFSNAYLYVLPSDLEGMPLSLLEAMSYGNCCLVSSIPECADVVSNQGVVFRKGNIVDLKKQMQRLLDHPEQVKRFKETASGYICSKYSWDKTIKQTISLYQ